jgi:hypothetical protein
MANNAKNPHFASLFVVVNGKMKEKNAVNVNYHKITVDSKDYREF